MRRRMYAARILFHDWMWKGGTKPRNPVRRLARRLPLYFSDPYYMTRAEIDRLIFEHPGPFAVIDQVTTAPEPMQTPPGWRLSTYPQTWSTGTAMRIDWHGSE